MNPSSPAGRGSRPHPVTRASLGAAVAAAFLLVVLAAPVAWSQGDPELVDPVPPSLYTMIADDELLLWVGDRMSFELRVGDLATVASDLKTVTEQDLPFSIPGSGRDPEGYYSGVRTAAGRVVSPLADQLLFATQQGFFTAGNCQVILYDVDGFLDPAVAELDVPEADHNACLVGGTADPQWGRSPYALAAGDLDRVADTEGVFHDEVILAHEEGNPDLDPVGGLSILVLDYSGGDQPPVATEVTPYGPGVDEIYSLYKDPDKDFPGTLRVDTFDGRGDGTRQIVTAHAATWNGGKDQGVAISVFEYQGPNQLTSLGSQGFELSKVDTDIGLEGFPFAIATGDFNGDGKDEIAAVITQGARSETPDDNLLAKNLVLLGLDGNELTVLSQDGFFDEVGLMPSCDNDGGYVSGSVKQRGCSNVELASGLFVFDPDRGFGLTRRQLAFAFTSFDSKGNGTVDVHVYEISSDNRKTTIAESGDDLRQGRRRASPRGASGAAVPSVLFGLGVGNFAGVDQVVNDENPPFDQVAVLSATSSGGVDSASLQVYEISASSGTTEIGLAVEQDFHATDVPFDIARIQPFDYDGDAIVLGPPVVFAMENVTNVVSVLEAPPQHVDYLPNAPHADPATGLWVVSRSKEFQLELNQGHTDTFEGSQTSMVSTSVGASDEASASATVSGDAMIAKGSVSGEIEGKLSFAKDNSSINTQGVSNTVTFDTSEAPTSDDAVATFVSLAQVWRYRVYGAEGSDPDNPNLYYEIYVPQGTVPNSLVWQSGLTLVDDGTYQPLHENGNILSYPELGQSTHVTPPDLGAWSLPSSCAPDPPQPQSTPIASAPIMQFGGSSPKWKATFEESTSCGQERSNDKTLEASVSVKTTIKAEASVIFEKDKAKASVEAEVSGSKSWSSLSTYDNTSTSGAELLISSDSTETFAPYQFLPTIYFAQDGAAKVVFATGGIPASCDDLWQDLYGNPDPALNLPQKFSWGGDDEDQPVFNTRTNGRRMRGFFARDATQIDAATGLGPLLDLESLTWGNPVQLEVMVYNYSVCCDDPKACEAASFSDLDVRFDVAAFDSQSQSFLERTTVGTATAQFTDEHANPEGPPIGTTFSPRGVGRATLTLDLDPAKLPLGNGSEAVTYALFAVLDPDEAIDETHPWRVPTVGIVPFTNGQPSVGDLLQVEVQDDSGTTVGTVQVTSVGTVEKDVTALAEAIADNDIAETYGLAASRFPDPEIPGPDDEPFMVIVSAPGNMTLPASDTTLGTLAFAKPVQGTGSLTFIASIATSTHDAAGTPSILSSNLALGQNNEGYGLFRVGPQASTLQATTAAPQEPRRNETGEGR